MKDIKKIIPGVTLCLVIAVIACFIVKQTDVFALMGAPVLAILMSMILVLGVPLRADLKYGVAFTSKKVLQLAVVLLGFGLNLSTLGKIGVTSLPVIVFTIATSLIVAFVLQRLLKIPAKTATLIGVGSSICGGSAIAATAPVIDANDGEIAQAVSVIFLFNVIAALIFPSIGAKLGMSNESFGLFAGTAVNDTSSVTAVASTWDTLHETGGSVLEYATVVKLTRTLAIIPITLVLSIVYFRKRSHANEAVRSFKLSSILPMFVVYFVLASVVTTVLLQSCSGVALEYINGMFGVLKGLSKFFIVMSMAAIGLNANLIDLLKRGGKPIFLGFTCWITITLVSIGLQRYLGL